MRTDCRSALLFLPEAAVVVTLAVVPPSAICEAEGVEPVWALIVSESVDISSAMTDMAASKLVICVDKEAFSAAEQVTVEDVLAISVAIVAMEGDEENSPAAVSKAAKSVIISAQVVGTALELLLALNLPDTLAAAVVLAAVIASEFACKFFALVRRSDVDSLQDEMAVITSSSNFRQMLKFPRHIFFCRATLVAAAANEQFVFIVAERVSRAVSLQHVQAASEDNLAQVAVMLRNETTSTLHASATVE